MKKHLILFLFYRKMLDPGLMLCSKQGMFLNLVYKSLKADIVLRRVKAFVKRLLQVTCEQMPPFICGALYLVSEIDHKETFSEVHICHFLRTPRSNRKRL